ncbi:MAG TPA: carboxypeptidase regulatory-like domain-containing protein [Candidatus Brocadiaceae bacterium]|nr:carboxypeptidase regulatory-like domain-containing protein [Candidatus Brocadiaceae bacterium]
MRDLIAKGFLKYIICLLGLAVFLSGGVVPSFADKCRNTNNDFVRSDDGDDDDDDDDDDDGSHHAGTNCLTGGCHTGGEHRFTIGGTIYSNINGTEARAGAQITVTGSNNQRTVLTSDRLGNFHSSQSIPAPYTITASYLGREVKMPSTAITGGCNDNNCHVVGNGAAGRVFITTNDLDLTGTITETSGNSGISYNGTIKAILDTKCIVCHKAGGSKSDVPLTTYDEVTIPRLVTTGSKDSLLIRKLNKQLSEGTMWPSLRSAREYNQIKDWIVLHHAQEDSTSGGVVSVATIQLTQGGQVKYSTTTSQAGAFVLKSVMAGAYSVRVSKKGYKTYTQPYQMNQINVPPLNIAIKKK